MIKYDKALNREMYRIVHNFNQKRNRAIKRGFTNLPPRMRVSELKARYSSRDALKDELLQLQKFNTMGKEALEVIETTGGAKTIQWTYDYLKHNVKAAKEYYTREIKEVAGTETEMRVAKDEYLNNLIDKRAYLEYELDYLSQSEFNTFAKTIDEFKNAEKRNLQAYRGWMNEVEQIMRRLGYDDEKINKFFEGFDELKPHQFVRLYRTKSIIKRIYELYIPTNDGDFKLSTTEKDADAIIDTFMKEKDEMIKEAKEW